MKNSGTVIVGTEKTVSSLSRFYASEDISVLSAYSIKSLVMIDALEYYETKHFIESCSIIEPETGCEKNSMLFSLTDFKIDNLYEDISRFAITQSALNRFSLTFPEHYLVGSELTVALTAHTYEQIGYSPLIIIHSDEGNLMNFCFQKKWNFVYLGEGDTNISKSVQEIINSIVSSRSVVETKFISTGD